LGNCGEVSFFTSFSSAAVTGFSGKDEQLSRLEIIEIGYSGIKLFYKLIIIGYVFFGNAGNMSDDSRENIPFFYSVSV
jgi:hypothetical protein